MEFLTKETFIKKIFDYENNKDWKFNGDKPAIIDFYADWCGPCRALSPVMDQLSTDYQGKVDIFKIDTEQEQELSALFGIRSIPSVLFIPVGDTPRMSVGAMQLADYKQGIKDLFNIEA